MPKRYRIILAVGICVVAFLAAYFAGTPSAPTDSPEVEFDQHNVRSETDAEPTPDDPAQAREPPVEPKPEPQPEAVEPDTPPLPPGFRLHLVQDNETMQSIALAVYGEEAAWTLIAHENPFEDPIKLIPGTTLRLPPIDYERPGDPQETEHLPAAPIIHVVKKNETLGHIAVLYYGKASKWELIFQANRDKLRSPNMVRAGMKLTIPPDFEDE